MQCPADFTSCLSSEEIPDSERRFFTSLSCCLVWAENKGAPR